MADAEAPVPGFRTRVGYQAMLLGGFATLAAAFLALGDISTRGPIADREAEDIRTSLSQVVPDQLHDNNLLEDQLSLQQAGQTVLVYRGTLKGKVSAVAFPISGKGYSGTISLIMGVAADGKILGVRVLAHSETPGLGDKIEEKKDDWIFSFNGHSLDNTSNQEWAVKKDGGRFDQFSGATITPRAVVKAIKEGLEFFRAHQQQLLAVIPASGEGGKADES